MIVKGGRGRQKDKRRAGNTIFESLLDWILLEPLGRLRIRPGGKGLLLSSLILK